MKRHMLTVHKTEFESDSNLAAKDHFIRGELKRKQNNLKTVNNYNWKCKHCDQSYVYKSLRPHMLTFHKTEFEKLPCTINRRKKQQRATPQFLPIAIRRGKKCMTTTGMCTTTIPPRESVPGTLLAIGTRKRLSKKQPPVRWDECPDQ